MTMLRTADIAARYGISQDTVRRHARSGLLPRVQGCPGQMYLFDEKDVEAFFKPKSFTMKMPRKIKPVVN